MPRQRRRMCIDRKNEANWVGSQEMRQRECLWSTLAPEMTMRGLEWRHCPNQCPRRDPEVNRIRRRSLRTGFQSRNRTMWWFCGKIHSRSSSKNRSEQRLDVNTSVALQCNLNLVKNNTKLFYARLSWSFSTATRQSVVSAK